MISWSIGLCCVLGTVAFAAEAENSTSAYFITRNNKRLEGKTIRTIDSPSLLSCSQTCLKHLWCTSTNFEESFGKTSKGNCELNRHEFSPFDDETQLTNKAGSTFALVLKGCLMTRCYNGASCCSEQGGETLPRPTKLPINGENYQPEFNATFTCDNSMEIFADGQRLGTDSIWENPTTYLVPGNTRVLSVAGEDYGGGFLGILGSTSNGQVTNETWKCSSVLYPRWNLPDFGDQGWHSANVIANHGDNPWKTINGIATAAKWIWANNKSKTAYCRLNLK